MIPLTTLMQHRMSVLLVGPPGCGKTARIRAAADKAGYSVITTRLAQLDRVDVVGALVPDTKRGVTRTLPLEWVHALRTATKPCVWFLDDLGQAPQDVQGAVLKYFDAGELPPHVVIWAATNRPEDRAGVVGLISPLVSRFHATYTINPAASSSSSSNAGGVPLATWQEEVTEWVNWASAAYPQAAEVVAWHRLVITPGGESEYPTGQPPVLYGWSPEAEADPASRYPDYRGWEAVLRKWSVGLRSWADVASAVGPQQASAMLAWVDGAQKAPAIGEILADPDNCRLPDGQYTLTGQRLVSAAALAAANSSALEAFARYTARWPEQWAYWVAREIFRVAPGFAGTAAWSTWFRQHRDLFGP